MRKFVVLSNLMFVLAFLATAPMSGQTQVTKPTTATKPIAKKAVTVNANDELIKLAQAGMSEEILLAMVAKTDKSRYNTSAAALLKLKDAGASQQVIAAVLGVSVSGNSAPTSHPVTVVLPEKQHVGVSLDAPSTVSLDGREAGIYFLTGRKLEQLEPSVYSGETTKGKYWNNVLAFIPKNMQAVIRSSASNLRIQNSTPTFYFFFEVKGAGLSNTGGSLNEYMNSASSPNEFVLVRMKVNKDERQITIAKSSSVNDRIGVPSKDAIDFSSKKLRSGVYEVRPRNSLPTGEYCFFYQGGTANKGGSGKLFDFGVDPGASSR